MGENSKIEWTDHTFNPWVGCTKVSPACDHCYAESWAKRAGREELWAGERRRTSDANWRKPLKWNREAEERGVRYRVFCASLADVFDNQVPERWRDDLWHRIEQTPHLDWLLLTKRPQNIAKMLPDPRIGTKPWADGWPNVWLGTTVENQTEADRRIPHLMNVPAHIHFLSCEPLLGPVDLRAWTTFPDDVARYYDAVPAPAHVVEILPNKIDWVIVGGESGPGARPMRPDWARSLRDQCAAAGTAFFFKQWGRWLPMDQAPDGTGHRQRRRWYDYRNRTYDIGKKAAGRLLDGREHNEFPKVA